MPGLSHNGRAGASPLCSLALALLAALVVVVGVSSVLHPVFYINDDAGLQTILAGSVSGTPDPHAVYMNVLACLPVTWLFQVAPGNPWFLYALEAGMFFACSALGYVVARNAGYILPPGISGLARPAALLGMACVADLMLFWAYVASPDYTIESAILSGASTVLLVAALEGRDVGKAEKRVMMACSVLLLGLSFCVRQQGGMVGMAFFALVCLFHAVRTARAGGSAGRLKRAASAFAPFCAVLLLAAVAYGAQAVAYSSPEWKAYDEYNLARTAYFDYGRVSFKEHPERYAAVGWDESLKSLVNSWFFMDERVTADAFEALSSGEGVVTPRNPVKALVLDKHAFNDPTLATHIALMLCLCVLCALAGKERGLRWQPAGLALASFALIGYLAVSGRFLYRAAVCATFPALLGCLAYALALSSWISGGGGKPAGNSPRMPSMALLAACACVELALLVVFMRGGVSGHKNVVSLAAALVAIAFIAYSLKAKAACAQPGHVWCAVLLVGLLACAAPASSTVKRVHNVEAGAAKYEAVFGYVAAHPDDVFVHGPGLSTLNPRLMPTANYISWGGWTYASPLKSEAYERAGYPDGIYAKDFLDDGVCVISGNPATIKQLSAYYASNFDKPVSYQVVESLGHDTNVYKFAYT